MVHKPTPPTQSDISQGFISPYEFANLGKPIFTSKPLRGEQTSMKGTGPFPNEVKDFVIGLEDIDNALMFHIEKNIKPNVLQNGNRLAVPLVYGSPERWSAIQKDGYYRDKNGKAMYPLIVIKRENISKNKDIGNKLDGNRVSLYKNFENQYTQRNQYDNFGDILNRVPQKEYLTVVIPDYVTITYKCVMFTNFVEQMNGLVEAFNFAANSYWGDKERFMFKSQIDNFSTFNETNQGEDRIIKSECTIITNGYLIPDTINKDLVSLKKQYSKVTIKILGEEILNGVF